MTITPVGIYPTSTSVVAVGGTAVTIMYGPVQGGLIVNPYSAADQGLSVPEYLYVNIVGPAAAIETATTVAIAPGQLYTVPSNQTTNVSVNAASSGHKFTAITYQPQSPVIPAELIGLINPCLQNVIKSYLYQQYANDDDLQAFVASFNTIAQQYVTWLNAVSLPVYTGPLIVGDLLDWVALGLYGVARPVLSIGNAITRGPFNSWALNSIPFNGRKLLHTAPYVPVNDDIFKRVLTWKLYKGDGKTTNVRWLKRRILRFLLGANGTDINTGDTSKVSVTFGGNTITITVIKDKFVRTSKSALLNAFTFNTVPFNVSTQHVKLTQTIEEFTHDNQININLPNTLPNIQVFKEAVDQGVLDMPFQLKTVVNLI